MNKQKLEDYIEKIKTNNATRRRCYQHWIVTLDLIASVEAVSNIKVSTIASRQVISVMNSTDIS